MAKNTVTPIKEIKVNSAYTYEVTMLVHVIADNQATAKAQLDEKGGFVTKRDVKLINSVALYDGSKDK
jgi:hypothetical protein